MTALWGMDGVWKTEASKASCLQLSSLRAFLRLGPPAFASQLPTKFTPNWRFAN